MKTSIRVLLFIALISLASFLMVDWIWFLSGELHVTAATKPWFYSGGAVVLLSAMQRLAIFR